MSYQYSTLAQALQEVQRMGSNNKSNGQRYNFFVIVEEAIPVSDSRGTDLVAKLFISHPSLDNTPWAGRNVECMLFARDRNNLPTVRNSIPGSLRRDIIRLHRVKVQFFKDKPQIVAQVKPTGDVSAWALFDVSQLAPPPAMPHPYLHSHAVATRNLQVDRANLESLKGWLQASVQPIPVMAWGAPAILPPGARLPSIPRAGSAHAQPGPPALSTAAVIPINGQGGVLHTLPPQPWMPPVQAHARQHAQAKNLHHSFSNNSAGHTAAQGYGLNAQVGRGMYTAEASGVERAGPYSVRVNGVGGQQAAGAPTSSAAAGAAPAAVARPIAQMAAVDGGHQALRRVLPQGHSLSKMLQHTLSDPPHAVEWICKLLAIDYKMYPRYLVLFLWDGTDVPPLPPSLCTPVPALQDAAPLPAWVDEECVRERALPLATYRVSAELQVRQLEGRLKPDAVPEGGGAGLAEGGTIAGSAGPSGVEGTAAATALAALPTCQETAALVAAAAAAAGPARADASEHHLPGSSSSSHGEAPLQGPPVTAQLDQAAAAAVSATAEQGIGQSALGLASGGQPSPVSQAKVLLTWAAPNMPLLGSVVPFIVPVEFLWPIPNTDVQSPRGRSASAPYTAVVGQKRTAAAAADTAQPPGKSRLGIHSSAGMALLPADSADQEHSTGGRTGVHVAAPAAAAEPAASARSRDTTPVPAADSLGTSSAGAIGSGLAAAPAAAPCPKLPVWLEVGRWYKIKNVAGFIQQGQLQAMMYSRTRMVPRGQDGASINASAAGSNTGSSSEAYYNQRLAAVYGDCPITAGSVSVSAAIAAGTLNCALSSTLETPPGSNKQPLPVAQISAASGSGSAFMQGVVRKATGCPTGRGMGANLLSNRQAHAYNTREKGKAAASKPSGALAAQLQKSSHRVGHETPQRTTAWILQEHGFFGGPSRHVQWMPNAYAAEPSRFISRVRNTCASMPVRTIRSVLMQAGSAGCEPARVHARVLAMQPDPRNGEGAMSTLLRLAGGAMLYKEMTQQAAQRDGDALGPRDISEPAMYAAQVLLQDATGWLSAALLGWEANDFFDAVASAEDAYGHTAVAKHAQQCLAEQVARMLDHSSPDGVWVDCVLRPLYRFKSSSRQSAAYRIQDTYLLPPP